MPNDGSIDYLNDPLLTTLDEKPKVEGTPLLERAEEVVSRINAFIEETGSVPVSEPGKSVKERMLANELAGLRASRASLDGLRNLVEHGLIHGSEIALNPTNDPLLADDSPIFNVRDELKSIARPDYVADRRPCPDFDRFEPSFEEVKRDVAEGKRQPQRFQQERVELGEFFVLKGQLVHVADVGEEHERNGKPDARLRVIFDNATESNLLMSSLVRRLYEDKDAMRVGTLDAGPLFQSKKAAGARTGFVYVVRSLSDRPEVSGLLKVGTTAGAVEDRIARAESQASFLYAPVEIVETFELFGLSAKEAEARVHNALKAFNTRLKVTGPDGRNFNATEWFKASPATVEAAVLSVVR